MDFETELRERLHAGVDDTPVDVGELINGGVTKGKLFVRRRRLAQLVAGTAMVAVIGSVAAYAGSLRDQADPQIGPAATSTQAQREQAALTPQAAVAILLDLLPADGRTGDYTGGSYPKPGLANEVWARFTYTDAKGPSNLSLGVMPEAMPLSCAGQAPTCTVTTLPNGSKLMLEETVSLDGSNLRTRQAHLVRADGLYISLISDNGKYWKDDGTRAQPPLSLAQLRAIVTSPRWQHKVDADLVDRSAQLFVPHTPPPSSTPPGTPSSPSSSGSPR